MVNYIKYMPYELQNKILYECMIHPTASIIHKLIKEVKDYTIEEIDLTTKKVYKNNFYEILQKLDFLDDSDDYWFSLYIYSVLNDDFAY